MKKSLVNSFNNTNLDVESPLPTGGPNHFQQYDHIHAYTPTNTYLDQFQEAASPNSAFGINGTQLNPQNIFNKTPGGTSLDIENPLPDGGPNRNNAGANNIPSGFYSQTSAEGALLDQSGTISAPILLHRYLPNKKYIDTLSPNVKPSNS